MAERISAYDWSATSLGPLASWPRSLTAIVDLMLATPQLASLVVGPDRIFLYNDEAARHYGAQHPGALGQSLFDAFSPEADQVAPFYDRAFAGESLHIPAQQLDPAQVGSPEIFDAYLMPIRDEAGGVIAVYMTGTAVSPRVRAEAALRDSETRLRTLVGSGAVTVYHMSADWRLMNEMDSANFLARTPEPVENWPEHYILPDDQPMVFAAIDAAVRNRATFDLEHRVRLADGSVGWVASRAVPILGSNGEIVEWFGAASDITDRMRAKEAVSESEKKYRTLFDSIDQGFCTIEVLFSDDGRAVDYKFLELNPAFEGQTGLTRASGKRMRELAPDHEEFWFETYGRIARSGKPERFEHQAAALGRWYSVYAFGLDGDQPNRIAILFDDITDRKMAAAALSESEARLAAAFESVPVGVAVIDQAGRIMISNSEYRRFLPNGVIPSRDPKDGWRWRAWTEDRQPLDPSGYPGARAMRGEQVVPGQEMLFTDHAGKEIWTRVASVPVRDAEGKLTAQASVISDIDLLKRNADALRDSQAHQAFMLDLSDTLRPLTDASAIQTAAMEKLGQYLGASRAVYALVIGDEGAERLSVNGQYVTVGDPVPRSLPAHAFGPWLAAAMVRGESITVADVSTDPRVPDADRDIHMALHMAAYLCVSLLKNGRAAAVLSVHSDVPRTWSTAELTLLSEVADRTWDAVERARAEAALRLSEERLRQFGEASQDILWLRDAATLQWIYLTPAFEQIYGLSRQDALTGDNYRNWQDLIVSEDRELASAAIERVRAGEHVTFEYRVRRPSDGAVRWLRNNDFPITDEEGSVVLIGGIGHDFTEFRETEMRFRTLVEKMPQLVWRAIDGGEWTWASPQWTDCTGQKDAEYAGLGWLKVLHPDDRDAAQAAWAHALDDGGFEVEYRIRRETEGDYRWFQTRATPVRDPAGVVVEWLGTSTDVHELRSLRELQDTLLAELQHRVRNILAITRSIVSRSDDGERDTEDYVQHLQGRISALARTQVLLTRRANAGVDLEDLVRDELLAQVVSNDQFVIDGPDVKLSPKAAEVLTLAMHELATNATKYGAFSRVSGRLDVRWTVDDREGRKWLSLDWVESGVPIIDAAPRRKGFGAELISQRIPYELKGHGRFELRPGGLVTHIEFPLIAGDSVLQTDGVS